jgi:hypothetical protein
MSGDWDAGLYQLSDGSSNTSTEVMGLTISTVASSILPSSYERVAFLSGQ